VKSRPQKLWDSYMQQRRNCVISTLWLHSEDLLIRLLWLHRWPAVWLGAMTATVRTRSGCHGAGGPAVPAVTSRPAATWVVAAHYRSIDAACQLTLLMTSVAMFVDDCYTIAHVFHCMRRITGNVGGIIPEIARGLILALVYAHQHISMWKTVISDEIVDIKDIVAGINYFVQFPG